MMVGPESVTKQALACKCEERKVISREEVVGGELVALEAEMQKRGGRP